MALGSTYNAFGRLKVQQSHVCIILQAILGRLGRAAPQLPVFMCQQANRGWASILAYHRQGIGLTQRPYSQQPAS